MRSWLKTRWRAVVAVTAVVSLVAGVGVWTVVQQTGDHSGVDCSVRQAPTFEEASVIASFCGIDVEVTSERTPWQTSWSTAEGTSRVDVAAMPNQVLVDGEWTDLSRNIIDPRTSVQQPEARGSGAPNSVLSTTVSELPDPDPMLEVEAPAYPIELNPGGSDGEGQPLGRIEKDGHDLSVWFPVDLSEPEIDGDRLVYDLGGGVRLFVTVNTNATGFIPVIELRDESALDHLRELLGQATGTDSIPNFTIPLPTEASAGLTYELDDNELRLVDASEEVQFRATWPTMWDSSAGDTLVNELGEEVAIDRSHWPADGDQIADIGVSLQGTTLVLDPDDDMLVDADTVWPVYIDPPFGARAPVEWIATRTGGYTNTRHLWGDQASGSPGQGTGRCDSLPSCNVVFSQRLTWEFNNLSFISGLASSDIVSAEFNVNGQHSANCSAHRTTLHHSGPISSTTTWSGQVWYGTDGYRDEAHSETCRNRGFRPFGATNIIKALADSSSTAIAMGLRVNESTITYWKRFRHDANLTIEYNRAPNTPTLLQLTNPSLSGCFRSGDSGLPPAINSTTPTLNGRFTDPDSGQQVKPFFQVVVAGDATNVRWTSQDPAAVSAGLANTTNATEVVSSGLVNGGTYAWRARGLDTQETGGRYGPWSEWCHFRIDTTSPATPIVTPVRSSVPAIYEEDRTRGGVGLAGAFIASRGTSTDVTGFRFSFNDPNLPSEPVSADASGNLRIEFPASLATAQEHTLRVQSVDSARNSSIIRTYTFTVGSPSEDAVWTLDEGVGTTAAQTMGADINPLRISGATWGEGPHGLFDSRDGDTSLVFDGVNDSATSENTVLDTTDSYVVSAHVLLDPTATSNGAAVVLGQDAVSISAFRLQYLAPCPTGGDGCWAFSVASATSGQSPLTVYATEPAVKGEWTHLLASYNASSTPTDPRTLQLWTCTIGTPTDPDPATPVGVELEVPSSFTPMSSTGGFSVGRGRIASANADWWKGQIDNIRVFTGEIVDPPKIRRMCQGAEATDFNAGEVALDPTVTMTGQ